ncbi:MAG: M14 family metallopeptidase [Gemmatimonadota bacterium]|jgi:hypothetical protein
MRFRQAVTGSLGVLFIAVSGLTPSFLSAQVTSPEAYLGFKPGADFHLMTYEQAMGYFELLASQTDRMLVLDMGETTAGRRMKYGVVSSAENLRRLDHFKELNRRISLPRGLSDQEAQALAEEGKAFVWIDGGLHGTEVAPAQLLPQLAYDLVTGDDRQMEMIRENVIALLVFANPDGMTIVSDWYMGNVGTPYEVSPIPWLYHEYVGHDNNRDSFMANLVETQNMNRAHSLEWYPHILYNQHQTGPFPARIWTPPDAEPTNPNVHPLIVRWKNHIGTAMGKAFEENGQPGAISRIRYDTWYPGYATQVVDGHNVASILTETQLYRYATPQHFTVNDFPEAHRDLTRGVFYPSPWPGGWWRIGDAVAYNSTACKAVLEVAARYRNELIYDKYRAGVDVVSRFLDEPPYGYIVPADQPNRSSAALLMERMLINGVEVYTADEAFEHNGIPYPAGTFVLPTSQPFGLFLKNIFERQTYPDLREYSHLWQGLVNPEDWEGGPLRPYDGVGWTLPLQMGVEYREMSSSLSVGLTRIEAVDLPVKAPSGGAFVFGAEDNASITAAMALLEAGVEVRRATEPFVLGGEPFRTGTYVVRGGGNAQRLVAEIARDTGLQVWNGSPGVPTVRIRFPRIGLHKAWVASMDAGWITYVFDTYGIPFQSVTNAEIKAGDLGNRFDVLVFADQSASDIIDGHAVGTIPPDYVGGIGDEGLVGLRDFVREGGRLLCNNRSCDLPLEYFDIPVTNVLREVSPDSFNVPGAILKAEFDAEHPVAYGMEERGTIFFSGGRAFEIGGLDPDTEGEAESAQANGPGELDEGRIRVVASYPDEPLLLSGWMIGDHYLQERAAALDIPLGEGRVLAFGFNVHNRAQARSTMRMLFNALFYE